MFKNFKRLVRVLGIFSFLLFIVAIKLSTPVHAQTVDWLRQIHIPSEVEGRVVKTDVEGYVYLLGTTYGSDGRNAFLKKYDSNGNEIWVRQFGNGSFNPSGMAIEGTFVYISGGIESGYPEDMAVFKYDAEGNQVWESRFGAIGDNLHSKIAVNESGIYVTGGDGRAFVAKLDGGGNKLWVHQPNINIHNGGMGIGINSSYLYVTGFQYGIGGGAFIVKYDFDGNEIWRRQFDTPDGASEGIVTNDGIFIAGFQDDVYHYDFDGNRVWATRFGIGGGCLYPSGIAADTTGVYLTAGGSCFFPDEVGVGGTDVFVAKLDTNGNLVWHYDFGSTGNDAGTSIVVNGSNIYVTGIAGNDMFGQIDMGRITDAFIAKISLPNSAPVANAGFDTTVIKGQGVTFDGSGSIDPDGQSDIVSYAWNFGDGTTGNGATVNHTYSQAGIYTVTLTVVDAAGATGADTVMVTVLTPAQATQNLINLVQTYNLQQGISNSLDVKLNAAIEALGDLNDNNNTAAVSSLQAFINAVEAQRGGKITNEQADTLIQKAQEIINSLS